MEVLSKELATKEVNRWLDFQDISEDQRKDVAANVNILVNAVMQGRIVINEDNSIIQNFKFPFGLEAKVNNIKFKSSGISIGDVEEQKSKIPATYSDKNTMAHISAATGELVSTLMKMNPKDYNVSAAIIIFFMV